MIHSLILEVCADDNWKGVSGNVYAQREKRTGKNILEHFTLMVLEMGCFWKPLASNCIKVSQFFSAHTTCIELPSLPMILRSGIPFSAINWEFGGPYWDRSPCQSVFYTQSWLPDSTLLTCRPPLPTTYAPYIISFLVFCWQLLGPSSNLQLFMQLKPYCQHPYPQYTTIPVMWAGLFRNEHEEEREIGGG